MSIAHPALPGSPGLGDRTRGRGRAAADTAMAPDRAAAAVRFGAFCVLLLFGTMHWARQVAPTDTRAGLLCAVVGAAVAAGLIACSALEGRGRTAALSGIALAGTVAVLPACGIPVRLAWPRNWDELAPGIYRGLEVLPVLNVPYRGLDDWVRQTIMVGGGLLGVLAAVLTYGRPADRAGRLPLAGALALGVLYGLSIVERNPEAPFLSGAIFALALAAFLGAGGLGRRGAAVTGAGVAVLAVLVAMVVAPRLDPEDPWIDYRSLTGGMGDGNRASFSWDHSYTPLDWPRDGREVLRVRARRGNYWKTTNLDRFDGVRWTYQRPLDPNEPDTEYDSSQTEWEDSGTFILRNLTTRELPGAGVTREVREVPRNVENAGGGTYRTTGRALRPGDTYQADMYVPRPDADTMRAAGTDYPPFVDRYLRVELPEAVGGPGTGAGLGASAVRVEFPAFGDEENGTTVYPPDSVPYQGGAAVVEASRYGRAYALAQRLRAAADTPLEFVRAVRRRVQEGATYSETPPQVAVPLDTFLFDDRTGYCQQFSGAMALLLRMGGVPARVAAGFTPGTFDSERGEYIVRDLDAHSWVEAYFPGSGWVTFDPTPSEAPPAAQLQADEEDQDLPELPDAGRDPGGAPDLGPAFPTPGGPTATGGGGTSPLLLGGLGALALALAGGAWALLRKPVPGPGEDLALADLRRALERSGRPLRPGATLQALEGSFSAPEAQGYVRALRLRRYGGSAEVPPRAGRAALRRELAAGLGTAGRLRAWWALPPRP